MIIKFPIVALLLCLPLFLFAQKDKKKHVVIGPYYNNETRFNDLSKALLHKNDAKELSIAGIENLPKEFYELSHLSKLTIRKGLRKIDDRIENFTSLEVLNLIDDDITQLPIEIKNCQNLREIRIINCKLQDIPKELFELPRLQVLILKNNDIERIPCDFIDNYSLKELNLKYNKISLIPDCIQRLYGLEALYLSGNPIGLIQGKWDGEKTFRHLETLSMSDCKLESVPTGLTKNISFLDLSSNKIKEITFDDVQSMTNVNFLSLENNPITFLDESTLQIHPLSTLQIDVHEEIIDALYMSNKVCVSYTGQGYNKRLDDFKQCGRKKGMIVVFLYEPIPKPK